MFPSVTGDPMQLGVQTHFSQGWSTTLLSKLKDLGITEIRDEQEWNKVEIKTGQYSFPTGLTNYMDKAEAIGVDTLLVFTSANTLYDSGKTPYSAEGRQAYANYIVNVLQKYGTQVKEIEIWNEFNGGGFNSPTGLDDATHYTQLLKTVWDTVKPLFPDVKILGGSTLSVGVGALEEIFQKGALNYMDAVAVHPYRDNPEHVDDELSHLNDVMAKYGAVKPIYATEFGKWFESAAEAPDWMVKMVTLMSSAHVTEATWYALIDEVYYKNMGLFTAAGEAKPAAAAFALVQKELLSQGDAVRVDTGDDMTLVYRYGADTYVMWSAGRNVSIAPGAHVYNSLGQEIAAPSQLSMTPIIVKGGYTLGSSNIIADSLMQFGEGDWQYFAKDKNGLTELYNKDWDWTSYLGSKYTNPLRVNADAVTPAGDGKNPVQVMERFVSDRDQAIKIDASWTTGAGDGVDLHILINGTEVFSKIFQGNFTLTDYALTLKAGDKLDFALGPNQTFGGDDSNRHITISRDAPPGMTLKGSAAADTLSGAGGDDLLIGGGGKNTLNGGAGFDTVSYADATNGITVKLGFSGAQNVANDRKDTLISIEGVIGSNFNDIITGDANVNTLNGGAGDDTLIGGGGMDTLTGGDGADRFVFQNVDDSKPGAFDTIRDFSHAQGDHIDLTAIDANNKNGGDQAFAMVNSFSSVRGQMTVTAETGGYLVQGDVNGDGMADFGIHVLTTTQLVASDFYL